MLAFDDDAVVYCNSDEEQLRARTAKDYLQAVLTSAGQSAAAASDHAQLPAALLAKGNAGVSAIDWAKTGGRPRTAPVVTQPTPIVTPPIVPVTPAPLVIPFPPPSNAFTVSGKPKVSVNTSITLSAKLPGAGKLAVKATAKSGPRTLTVASASASATVTRPARRRPVDGRFEREDVAEEDVAEGDDHDHVHTEGRQAAKRTTSVTLKRTKAKAKSKHRSAA